MSKIWKCNLFLKSLFFVTPRRKLGHAFFHSFSRCSFNAASTPFQHHFNITSTPLQHRFNTTSTPPQPLQRERPEGPQRARQGRQETRQGGPKGPNAAAERLLRGFIKTPCFYKGFSEPTPTSMPFLKFNGKTGLYTEYTLDGKFRDQRARARHTLDGKFPDQRALKNLHLTSG